MNLTDEVDRRFEEIAENFYIPAEIEPILKSALTAKLETETLFDEPEKEKLFYFRVKKSVDLRIAGLIKQCTKK